jgi:hypothetical protein
MSHALEMNSVTRKRNGKTNYSSSKLQLNCEYSVYLLEFQSLIQTMLIGHAI